MHKAKAMRIGLIVYTSFTAFLFVYVFPFIFIGYRGQADGIKPVQSSVLGVWSDSKAELPMLTRAAVCFAKYSVARLWLVVLVVLLMLGIEFVIKERGWKQDAYYVMMWANLAAFVFSLLGLIALLI